MKKQFYSPCQNIKQVESISRLYPVECFFIFVTGKLTGSVLFQQIEYPNNLVSQIEIKGVAITEGFGRHICMLKFCDRTTDQNICPVFGFTQLKKNLLVLLRKTVLPLIVPVRHIILRSPSVCTNMPWHMGKVMSPELTFTLK